MMEVHIWTDGGMYKSNPGPGGWAAILKAGTMVRAVGGYAIHATNNQMETEAVVGGLSVLRVPCKVVIHTDSEYVRRGINKITYKHKTHDTNVEVWQRVQAEMERHKVSVIWAKGHSGEKYNCLADAYAGYCAQYQVQIDEYLDDTEEVVKERKTKKKIRKLKEKEADDHGDLPQATSDP